MLKLNIESSVYQHYANGAIEGLVSPLTLSNVQGSSIDLTLGETIKVEAPVGSSGKWFDTSIKDAYDLAPWRVHPGPYGRDGHHPRGLCCHGPAAVICRPCGL